MNTFRIGDFIRLKNLSKHYLDITTLSDINIFEIKDIIEDVEYVITDCETRIPISDIEPIPINGQDDKYISFNSSPMAKYVDYNDVAPNMKCETSYFLDDFKQILDEDENKQEIVQNFKFVHEVQHYLRDEIEYSYSLIINK